VLTIVDLGRKPGVDCLLYNAHDTDERYSAPDTIAAAGNLFLTTGSGSAPGHGRP